MIHLAEDKKNNDKREKTEPQAQQKLDPALYSKKLESFMQRMDMIITEIATSMYTNNPGYNANLENSLNRIAESKFWLANLRTALANQQAAKEKSPIVKAN